MPIAYSQHPIISGSLRADTPHNTVADLAVQLAAAGWVLVRGITGGYVFICTTPDAAMYQAKLLIQDDLSYHADHPGVDLYNFRSVVFRFMNVDESVSSFQHQIKCNSTFAGFQTVIGRAQVFISVHGHDGTGWSAVAGGIPALPVAAGTCVEDLVRQLITDTWWTCGGSQWGFDFRTQAVCYACMSVYLNGIVVIAPDNNSISPDSGYLCLFPLTATNTLSSGQIPWPTITYSSHNVLNIDAWVGWNWGIRGQLWDAFLQTAGTTLDAIGAFFDESPGGGTFQVECLTWHSEFYSSLQLITDVKAVFTGNQAY